LEICGYYLLRFFPINRDSKQYAYYFSTGSKMENFVP
jgi:hypothetical protein